MSAYYFCSGLTENLIIEEYNGVQSGTILRLREKCFGGKHATIYVYVHICIYILKSHIAKRA